MSVLVLTDDQVIALIQGLPEAQKLRVLASLAKKKTPTKRPKFGSAKNDILYIADDFNAPLEDFKEYME